jgi:hypothetical protein
MVTRDALGFVARLAFFIDQHPYNLFRTLALGTCGQADLRCELPYAPKLQPFESIH